MAATARPQPIRPRFEPGLPLGFQRARRQGLQRPVGDHGNPQAAPFPARFRDEHPLDRPGPPRGRAALQPGRHVGFLPACQHDPPVDPGRLAASVDLRHPPHAHQSGRTGPEHQLLQITDPSQVPRLRRREDPLPQTPYVILGLAPIHGIPARRNVLRSVHHHRGIQLAHRFRCPCPSSLSRAHLTASAPFRARAPGPVSGQLSGTASGGASHHVPVSCCLSATGIRFSVTLFPPGSWAFLTVGLPGTTLRPDPDGVSTFHTCEIRPGWVPSLPRGRRCSSRPDAVPGRRLPLPSGQSLHPATASHQRGHSSRGINEGSRDSPVRSAPGLRPPGWDGKPLGFPLCSAPRRYRQRTTGRGRAVSTRPELRDRHSRPSNPRVPSQGATSCRNGK